MLDNFHELNRKHEQIFDVHLINGICIQHETKIFSNTSIVYDLLFLPTEVIVRNGPDGNPKMALAHATKMFHISTTTKMPEFEFTGVFDRTKVFVGKFYPLKNIEFMAKCLIHSGKYIPTFATKFQSQYCTLGIQAQTLDMRTFNTIDITSTIGKNDLMIGCQAVRRSDSYGVAILLHKAWKKAIGSVAVTLDDDISMFCCRMRKQINDKWTAGVNFQVNQYLNSSVSIGWKATIGKNVVHSAFSTEGLVKTHYRRHVTEKMDFIVSGFLNHQAHSYQLGIGLAWE